MSEVALQQLVRAVADAKRADPMAPVTVIVPSNLAGRTLGWRLAEGLGGGRNGIAGIRITTLSRLAEAVAAARLHPRRPLLPSILAAAWRAALEGEASTGSADVAGGSGASASSATGRPWVFGGVWDHASTVSALVRAYRDLREASEDDLPEGLQGTVSDETIRLAGLVRERLAPNWYDQQDLFAAASEVAASEPGAFAEFGWFLRYLVGEEQPSGERFLAALDGAFGVTTIDEPTTPESRVADRVLHASDSDDEVRMVVREVVSALSGEQKARRLAILYSRQDPYVRTIHAQLRAAGIQHNGRGGTAVAELASARAFIGLLELRARQYPRARVFEALSTWPLLQFGTGTPVRTVTWERLSREAHIAGGEAVETGWRRRLDDYAKHARERAKHRSEASQQYAERAAADAGDLSSFVLTLDSRLEALDGATTWQHASHLSLALLDELFGSVDDLKAWEHSELRAFLTLRSVLQGLVSLDAFGPPSGLAGLLDVLTTQLESAVPRTGTFGQGVFVGPISQAQGLDLDRVWVVGLSEDVYPGRQAEDALLPDELRQRTPGLVSARDRVERTERELAAAFRSAKHVTASFPRGDLRASTERLPSRLLLPTLRALSGDPDLPATQWQRAAWVDQVVDSPSFASSITSTDAPASSQEWSVRAAAALGEEFDDEAFQAGHDLRHARRSDDFTRYDGNLTGADGLPDLSTGEQLISPTRLEGYAGCPFAYFVQNLLGVEPVQEPDITAAISPLDLGNIFHYSMDRFVTAELEAGTLPGPGQPWRPEQYERLRAIAEQVIAEHEAAGLLGHPTLWSFDAPAVRASFTRLLDDDTAWRAANGSAPVAAELAFGFGDAPPVEVEVDSGVVRFRGSADKVDLVGDTVYVTDIKSGRATKFTAINKNPTVDGTKLQLPVYAKAARRAYGVADARARYWFIHGRDAGRTIELPLTDELDETFSHVVGTLASGIARGHFFKKPSKEPGYLWVDCEYCTPGGSGHETARNDYLRKRVDPGLVELLAVIDPDAVAAQPDGTEADA